MKLLPEFALIHDIFEGSPREVRFAVAYLYETLLTNGLIRDLRGGDWEQALLKRATDEKLNLSVRKIITELLKALSKRLVRSPSCIVTPPQTASDWCQEALASHRKTPLDAIIAGASTAREAGEATVRSLDELPDQSGDLVPAPSLRVRQQTADYLRHLHGVLTYARQICFIDPYLGEPGDYTEFPQIVLAMRKRSSPPEIEIHRAQKYAGLPIRKEADWREKFRDWDGQFSAAGLRVRIFIWGKLHNRYLLSDLLNLEIGWGFRTSKDVSAVDDWTRLGRDHSNEIARTFHENFPKSHLACLVCPPFYIGAK